MICLRQLSVYAVQKVKILLTVCQNDIILLHYFLFTVARSVDRTKKLAISETKFKNLKNSIGEEQDQTSIFFFNLV